MKKLFIWIRRVWLPVKEFFGDVWVWGVWLPATIISSLILLIVMFLMGDL